MSSKMLRNNTDKHRYELIDGGQVVGFVDYDITGDEVILKHTEVEAGHEGKGYGSALARQVLDEVLGRNKKIVVYCGFIAGYVKRHPEYDVEIRTES